MERRKFLGMLGLFPAIPALAAFSELAPQDDELVVRGNQITMGGKNVMRVVMTESGPQIDLGEPFTFRFEQSTEYAYGFKAT